MAKKTIETELTDAADGEDVSLEEELAQEQEQEGKAGKKKKEKKPKKEKKKGGFPVIPVVILLVAVGGIAAAFIFNLFSIQDTVVSYLRNAPLVGQFFPEPTEEPETETDNRFASMTPEELYAEFTGYEYEIERLETQVQDLQNQKDLDDETITYLREFEQQIEAVRNVKEQIDRLIVENGTPEAFAAYFKSVSPENAERLYQESVGETQYNQNIRTQANTFAEMDETTAADSLEAMLGSNSDLVISLLAAMSIEDRAAIFDEMEPSLVARINNLLEPAVPADVPAATTPPLPEGLPTPSPTQ